MDKYVTWGCRRRQLFSLLQAYASQFFLDLCELFCSQPLILQTTTMLGKGHQDI